MRGSFHLVDIFGIPVRLHWTFIFIGVGIVYYGGILGNGWVNMLWFTAIVFSLFFCVLLHEFGHALTARKYGVNTQDIILSPIGGIARLDRLPDLPLQEFYVAIAGPAVNIVIAILLSPFYFFATQSTKLQLKSLIIPTNNVFISDLSLFDSFIFFILFLNIILALFNLIPAFPMDGGRILRSLLAIPLKRIRATQIATYIGQALALTFILLGLTEYEIGNLRFSYMTAFIGLFVIVSASSEYKNVKIDQILKDHQVRQLLEKQFSLIYITDTMAQPIEIYTRGKEKSFIVVNEWNDPVKILDEKHLIDAVKKKQYNQKVQEYARDFSKTLLVGDSLSEALKIMQSGDHSLLPVYEDSKWVGILDLHAINNFLKLNK